MYIEADNFDPDRLLVNMIYFFIYLPTLLNVKSLGFVLELFKRQILKYCFLKIIHSFQIFVSLWSC